MILIKEILFEKTCSSSTRASKFVKKLIKEHLLVCTGESVESVNDCPTSEVIVSAHEVNLLNKRRYGSFPRFSLV